MTLTSFPQRYLGLMIATALNIAVLSVPQIAIAQAPESGAITLKSDIQESNSETGVITARGNVQINYPARQIQATATQAQYYSRERRLVLTGNVYVLQSGNSLRAEEMTYLIDEGKFIAT
ncbi:MAG: LptA/OstA family protein, partial [Cyanobacteria bacterium J06635_13]